MKRAYFLMLLATLFVISCSDNPAENLPQETQVDMSDFYVYTDEYLSYKSSDGSDFDKCHTMQVLNQKLKENPGLYQRMYNIERHTREFINAKGKPPGAGGGNGGNDGGGGGGGTGDPGITDYTTFPANTIPVIFHIIYSADSENISQERLDEQIIALNQDFNKANPNDVPSEAQFIDVKANIGVNFDIAGVIRVNNKKKKSWRPDDAMKFTASGGSDAIDPQHYLNVWVVNNMPYMGGNILGYAQFPGGDWATDGIVLDHRFVGNTPYSTGRTATHEIGHWMNLRHIWGDGPCGQDDFVLDTPESSSYNSGCPSTPPIKCNTPDMFMNFMDYTNDNCMTMFTQGQQERMAAVFTDSGFRSAMNVDIAFPNP